MGCARGRTAATATPAALWASEAWVRVAPAGQAGAAYLTIHNGTGRPAVLLKVRSDAATAAELHESREAGGVMQMAPVDGIPIAAGGAVELKPGGWHVMLMGLTRALHPGDQVELRLEFEAAGTLVVMAEVRAE